jgi:hypothetical protein
MRRFIGRGPILREGRLSEGQIKSRAVSAAVLPRSHLMTSSFVITTYVLVLVRPHKRAWPVTCIWVRVRVRV